MRTHYGSLVLAVLLKASVVAQPIDTPHETQRVPDIDQSRRVPDVALDSLLALRVDPGEYRGHDEVILLNDRHVRLEADGRSTITYRQVAQVITKAGADTWSHYSISYNESRQHFELNRLRVVRPDGTVISEGAEVEQETSYEANHGVPVYSDSRIVRFSAAGVREDVIVDYTYTIETFNPVLAGDYDLQWYGNLMSPVRLSRLVLDTPEDYPLRIREESWQGDFVERVEDGRRTREWTLRDQSAVKTEPYAGFPNDVFARVLVSGALEWDDVGSWYWPRIASKVRASPMVAEAAAEQLAGASTLEDTLRALHRWVAQDIRYTSVALGDGSHDPRAPDKVLETGFGDCKDKATLFVAAARGLGIDAMPVLVNASSGVDSLAPGILQFDHMIARVDRPGGADYIDLTVDLLPYGQLPYNLEGSVGVTLHEGGATEIVVLPQNPADENRFERSVVGRLDHDNRFTGLATVEAHGTSEYGIRSYFRNFSDLDSKSKADLIRNYVQSLTWEEAKVDSSEVFDALDLTTPPSVRIWFSVSDLLGQTGNRYTLNVPIPRYYDKSAVDNLGSIDERRFPIDVEQVNDQTIFVSRFEVELPVEWNADLPDDVEVSGLFGDYTASYRQVGNRVRIKREMSGRRGLEPPSALDELRFWLTSVAEDDHKSLSLWVGPAGRGIGENGFESAGKLPEIILGTTDLPEDEIQLRLEGAIGQSYLNSWDEPIESFGRIFAADQFFFTVGDTRFVTLDVDGATYPSGVQASNALMMFAMVDPTQVMSAFTAEASDQITVGEARTIDVSEVNPQSRGWVVTMTTPMFSMDAANVVIARGRAAISISAVALQGFQEKDLLALVKRMDDRLVKHPEYFESVEDTDADEEACALEVTVGETELDEILLTPSDFAGSHVRCEETEWRGDVPTYNKTLRGKAFTLPLISSEAMSITTTVSRFAGPDDALRELFHDERIDLSSWVVDRMEDAEMGKMFLHGDQSSMDMLPPVDAGWRSVTRTVRLRGAVNFNVDEVVFARGEYVVKLTVSRLSDATNPAEAAEIASRVDERLARALGEAGGQMPAESRIDALEAVVDAQTRVDSLSRAQDIEAALKVVEEAHLSESSFDFRANTWNNLCWFGSLNGYAERVMDACEAAVAPDSTSIPYLDSRGLARALAGDTAGAIRDFQYVVDNTRQAGLRGTRAPWLEKLRAGENPFTDEVLQELRGE